MPVFIGPERDYPKPDGKTTFDKLSSVFATGNATRDDAPNHIRIQDKVPLEVALMWQNMCPAQVYEVPDDQLEAATKNGKLDGKHEVKLQITPSNCVQCGAITAKGGRRRRPRAATGRTTSRPSRVPRLNSGATLILRSSATGEVDIGKPRGPSCVGVPGVKINPVVPTEGRVGPPHVHELTGALDRVELGSITLLVVDIGEVGFLDLSGLNAILKLNEECRGNDVHLSVIAPRGPGKRVFTLTRTDRELDLVDAAVRADR